MAGLRIPFQFFGEKKAITPSFWSQSVPFSFASFFIFFIHIIWKRSHQGSPREVPLGYLGFPRGSLGVPSGFPHLNIIDFTNCRPKMAAFSLKTFRIFFWRWRVIMQFWRSAGDILIFKWGCLWTEACKIQKYSNFCFTIRVEWWVFIFYFHCF